MLCVIFLPRCQNQHAAHALSIMLRISPRRLSATLGSKSSPGSLASASMVSRFAPLLSSSAQVSFRPCRAASCNGVRCEERDHMVRQRRARGGGVVEGRREGGRDGREGGREGVREGEREDYVILSVSRSTRVIVKFRGGHSVYCTNAHRI